MKLILNYITLFSIVFQSICAEELRQNEINKILNEHNRLRRVVTKGQNGLQVANMQKLIWNTALQERATRMATCDRNSEESQDLSFTVNVGQVRGKKFKRIIRRWFREIVYLIPEYKTCVHLEKCRHVLTMITADHRYLGCGYKTCNNNDISLTCIYGGGTDRFPVYQSGPPCTKCSGDSSFCDSGLCVKCNPLTENCDCRKTCQKASIGNGTLNAQSCTCDCIYGLGPNCDEECKNPEQYIDYDICSGVSREDCSSPFPEENEILKEFCPEQCLCSKYPIIFEDVWLGA